MDFVNAARRVLISCVVLGGAAGGLAPAWAAPSLSDALHGREDSRRANAPAVARYVSETGASFVVDRSAGSRLLLKFENSPEVWVLDGHAAPRGDTIYKAGRRYRTSPPTPAPSCRRGWSRAWSGRYPARN